MNHALRESLILRSNEQSLYQNCGGQADAAQPVTYSLPTAVQDAVHAFPTTLQATLRGATGACALYTRGEILVWQYDGGTTADVVARALPYASEGVHHLAILSNPEASAYWGPYALSVTHRQYRLPSHHLFPQHRILHITSVH